MSRSERLPWRRHYAADFAAETAHLTPAQLGVHVRLLDLAWQRINCALPNDEAWIARRVGLHGADYLTVVAPVLADFWHRIGPDLVNDELRSERAHAEMVSEERRQAALKRHYGPNVTPLKFKGKT